MEKIGIITLTGDKNYGNKLQNYAMERLLLSRGYSVETVRIDFRKHMAIWLRNELQFVFRFVLPSDRRNAVERKKLFLKFNHNLHFSRRTIVLHKTRPEKIQKILGKYDHLVYGSDQIWNTEFNSFSKVYLGYYAPKKKNYAVSASLGKSDLNEEERRLFSEGIDNFTEISLREDDGAELLKKISGRKIEITPDPTLCIKKQEWIELEKKYNVPEIYSFMYFLGDVPAGLSIDGSIIQASRTSCFGPSEFIYILHHADVVYTDSFHACVFSILFGKEVFIYDRKSSFSSMFSRIVTLLTRLHIPYNEQDGRIHIVSDALKERQVISGLQEQNACMHNYLNRIHK